MARGDGRAGGQPPKMPPARSGAKSLWAIAAAVLVVLAVMWALTFTALNVRGPERVFFTKDTWANGTVVLYVSDLDERGEVPIASLSANITTQGGGRLYAGPLGQNQSQGAFAFRVEWVDNDGSLTVTLNDDLRIGASPPEAADYLILSTLRLYSSGQPWGQFRFE